MLGYHGALPLNGHERVDEATILRIEDDESLQDHYEAVPGVGVSGPVLNDLPAQAELDGEGLVDECLPCWKPAVEGGRADFCSAGHFTHSDVQATLGEQLPRRGENPVAVLLRVDSEFPRQIRTHGPHFTEADAPVH